MAQTKLIQCGTDNCYIVSEGEDAILVDTGTAAFFDKVLAECSAYKMRLIFLTHPHFDHAENAAALSERFGVPVAMSADDLGIFDSYDTQPLRSYGIVGKVVLALSIKPLRGTKVGKPQNLVFVKDGDSLADYGINAKVLSLPGHTNGSMGLDVEGRDLLVGDELDNWLAPAVGHLYCDRDALRRSAEKIRSLGARTIFYGHGKPTQNRT